MTNEIENETEKLLSELSPESDVDKVVGNIKKILHKLPLNMDYHINEDIQLGQEVFFRISPNVEKRDKLGLNKNDFFKSGYELPFYLIKEKLSLNNINRFIEAQNLFVEHNQSITLEDLFFQIVFLYCSALDSIRLKNGLRSILLGKLPSEFEVNTVKSKFVCKFLILDFTQFS